jgi:hypothetical protein
MPMMRMKGRSVSHVPSLDVHVCNIVLLRGTCTAARGLQTTDRPEIVVQWQAAWCYTCSLLFVIIAQASCETALLCLLLWPGLCQKHGVCAQGCALPGGLDSRQLPVLVWDATNNLLVPVLHSEVRKWLPQEGNVCQLAGTKSSAFSTFVCFREAWVCYPAGAVQSREQRRRRGAGGHHKFQGWRRLQWREGGRTATVVERGGAHLHGHLLRAPRAHPHWQGSSESGPGARNER